MLKYLLILLLLIVNLVVNAIYLNKLKSTEGYTFKQSQTQNYLPYCAKYDTDKYGWGKLLSMDDFDMQFLYGGRNYTLNTNLVPSGFENKIKTLRFGPGKGGVLLDGEIYTGYLDTFCSAWTKGLFVNYEKQKIYGFTLPLAYSTAQNTWDWINIYDIDINNSTKISDIKKYVLSPDEDYGEQYVSYTNFIFNPSSPNSYFK